MTYRLVFQRRFVMGHRLNAGTSPQCAIPHGHNELVKVTLEANKPKRLDGNENFVELFAKAKKKWHHFIDNHLDHTLQLAHTDPLVTFFQTHEPHHVKRLVITHGDPTTEMLSACLMSKLQAFLATDHSTLYCSQIELQETPTNTVILAGKNAFLAALPEEIATTTPQRYWWQRPDFSINDLNQTKTTPPPTT